MLAPKAGFDGSLFRNNGKSKAICKRSHPDDKRKLFPKK